MTRFLTVLLDDEKIEIKDHTLRRKLEVPHSFDLNQIKYQDIVSKRGNSTSIRLVRFSEKDFHFNFKDTEIKLVFNSSRHRYKIFINSKFVDELTQKEGEVVKWFLTNLKRYSKL